MATKTGRTLGPVVIQLALAIYFTITALCLFSFGSSVSSEQISQALAFLNINTKILRIILGVIILFCAVILVLKFFMNTGVFGAIMMYVTLFFWIAVTAIVLYSSWNHHAELLSWCLSLSKNALIIGGLMCVD